MSTALQCDGGGGPYLVKDAVLGTDDLQIQFTSPDGEPISLKLQGAGGKLEVRFKYDNQRPRVIVYNRHRTPAPTPSIIAGEGGIKVRTPYLKRDDTFTRNDWDSTVNEYVASGKFTPTTEWSAPVKWLTDYVSTGKALISNEGSSETTTSITDFDKLCTPAHPHPLKDVVVRGGDRKTVFHLPQLPQDGKTQEYSSDCDMVGYDINKDTYIHFILKGDEKWTRVLVHPPTHQHKNLFSYFTKEIKHTYGFDVNEDFGMFMTGQTHNLFIPKEMHKIIKGIGYKPGGYDDGLLGGVWAKPKHNTRNIEVVYKWRVSSCGTTSANLNKGAMLPKIKSNDELIDRDTTVAQQTIGADFTQWGDNKEDIIKRLNITSTGIMYDTDTEKWSVRIPPFFEGYTQNLKWVKAPTTSKFEIRQKNKICELLKNPNPNLPDIYTAISELAPYEPIILNDNDILMDIAAGTAGPEDHDAVLRVSEGKLRAAIDIPGCQNIIIDNHFPLFKTALELEVSNNDSQSNKFYNKDGEIIWKGEYPYQSMGKNGNEGITQPVASILAPRAETSDFVPELANIDGPIRWRSVDKMPSSPKIQRNWLNTATAPLASETLEEGGDLVAWQLFLRMWNLTVHVYGPDSTQHGATVLKEAAGETLSHATDPNAPLSVVGGEPAVKCSVDADGFPCRKNAWLPQSSTKYKAAWALYPYIKTDRETDYSFDSNVNVYTLAPHTPQEYQEDGSGGRRWPYVFGLSNDDWNQGGTVSHIPFTKAARIIEINAPDKDGFETDGAEINYSYMDNWMINHPRFISPFAPNKRTHMGSETTINSFDIKIGFVPQYNSRIKSDLPNVFLDSLYDAGLSKDEVDEKRKNEGGSVAYFIPNVGVAGDSMQITTYVHYMGELGQWLELNRGKEYFITDNSGGIDQTGSPGKPGKYGFAYDPSTGVEERLVGPGGYNLTGVHTHVLPSVGYSVEQRPEGINPEYKLFPDRFEAWIEGNMLKVQRYDVVGLPNTPSGRAGWQQPLILEVTPPAVGGSSNYYNVARLIGSRLSENREELARTTRPTPTTRAVLCCPDSTGYSIIQDNDWDAVKNETTAHGTYCTKKGWSIVGGPRGSTFFYSGKDQDNFTDVYTSDITDRVIWYARQLLSADVRRPMVLGATSNGGPVPVPEVVGRSDHRSGTGVHTHVLPSVGYSVEQFPAAKNPQHTTWEDRFEAWIEGNELKVKRIDEGKVGHPWWQPLILEVTPPADWRLSTMNPPHHNLFKNRGWVSRRSLLYSGVTANSFSLEDRLSSELHTQYFILPVPEDDDNDAGPTDIKFLPYEFAMFDPEENGGVQVNEDEEEDDGGSLDPDMVRERKLNVNMGEGTVVQVFHNVRGVVSGGWPEDQQLPRPLCSAEKMTLSELESSLTLVRDKSVENVHRMSIGTGKSTLRLDDEGMSHFAKSDQQLVEVRGDRNHPYFLYNKYTIKYNSMPPIADSANRWYKETTNGQVTKQDDAWWSQDWGNSTVEFLEVQSELVYQTHLQERGIREDIEHKISTDGGVGGVQSSPGGANEMSPFALYKHKQYNHTLTGDRVDLNNPNDVASYIYGDVASPPASFKPLGHSTTIIYSNDYLGELPRAGISSFQKHQAHVVHIAPNPQFHYDSYLEFAPTSATTIVTNAITNVGSDGTSIWDTSHTTGANIWQPPSSSVPFQEAEAAVLGHPDQATFTPYQGFWGVLYNKPDSGYLNETMTSTMEHHCETLLPTDRPDEGAMEAEVDRQLDALKWEALFTEHPEIFKICDPKPPTAVVDGNTGFFEEFRRHLYAKLSISLWLMWNPVGSAELAQPEYKEIGGYDFVVPLEGPTSTSPGNKINDSMIHEKWNSLISDLMKGAELLAAMNSGYKLFKITSELELYDSRCSDGMNLSDGRFSGCGSGARVVGQNIAIATSPHTIYFDRDDDDIAYIKTIENTIVQTGQEDFSNPLDVLNLSFGFKDDDSLTNTAVTVKQNIDSLVAAYKSYNDVVGNVATEEVEVEASEFLKQHIIKIIDNATQNLPSHYFTLVRFGEKEYEVSENIKAGLMPNRHQAYDGYIDEKKFMFAPKHFTFPRDGYEGNTFLDEWVKVFEEKENYAERNDNLLDAVGTNFNNLLDKDNSSIKWLSFTVINAHDCLMTNDNLLSFEYVGSIKKFNAKVRACIVPDPDPPLKCILSNIDVNNAYPSISDSDDSKLKEYKCSNALYRHTELPDEFVRVPITHDDGVIRLRPIDKVELETIIIMKGDYEEDQNSNHKLIINHLKTLDKSNSEKKSLISQYANTFRESHTHTLRVDDCNHSPGSVKISRSNDIITSLDQTGTGNSCASVAGINIEVEADNGMTDKILTISSGLAIPHCVAGWRPEDVTLLSTEYTPYPTPGPEWDSLKNVLVRLDGSCDLDTRINRLLQTDEFKYIGPSDIHLPVYVAKKESQYSNTDTENSKLAMDPFATANKSQI